MRQKASSGPGALAGLTVLEVGHIIAGPFCGHLFADHGAEVIKVEPPGVGDPMRHWGRIHRGVGLYWPIIGRGKKSVELDLRSSEGQATFRRLACRADVVIENLRPGTMEKWSIGPDDLAAVNPGLVMVRISGYGQTGPYSSRAGFGLIAEAMSGFRHLSGEPEGKPVRVGVSIGDTISAMQGFIGALMALWSRDNEMAGSGLGQVIDVALYESMFMHMESIAAEYDTLGHSRQPSGSTLPGVAPSNAYPTADGRWVLIGANQDSVFRRLADAVGRPHVAEPGGRYSTHELRGIAQEEIDSKLAMWTSERSLELVLRIMSDAGVPAGRVYTADDIVGDPHYRDREVLVRVPEPNLDGEEVLEPNVLPKMSGTPGVVRRGAPLLGEHTAEILSDMAETSLQTSSR